MKTYIYSRIKGIALIQVLLLSAILSVFALYMTESARGQVKHAQMAQDKLQALVDVKNAETKVLFELLTANKSRTQSNADNPSLLSNAPVNFFAEPFMIDSTEVKLQDQSGLIQLHFPNVSRLRALLASITGNEEQAKYLVDSLLDWQDIDNIQKTHGNEQEQYQGIFVRNGNVPFIEELRFVKGFEPEILNQLEKSVSIHKVGAFSPYNAPVDILRFMIDEAALASIIELRKSHKMTPSLFRQLSQISEDDSLFIYTSNYVSINLKRNVGDAKYEKQLIVHLRPYAVGEQLPINVFINKTL